MLTDKDQKKAAKEFVAFWQGKGNEKSQSQSFWLALLRDVYGVAHPENYIHFEDKVHLAHDSFIDGMIPAAKVMIEQKSIGKKLGKAIRQSDGTLLTPFQQAKRYITELPVSQHPRYVITCNFAEFWVYDMEKPNGEPAVIKLADLPQEYYRLSFLADTGNVHLKKELEVSIQAGRLVGKLYDALRAQYHDPDSERAMKSLNVLCVRLVFCLYAEDAGIFGKKEMFHDYLASFRAKNMRLALAHLFKVLDQKPEDRDPYMDDDLAAFPYVNGGLFANEDIEIPKFTDEIIELLLTECSENFDWSDISPTIFGAVFESTLNPETRRSGGMHYTSIENIHKVIDPLFLDDLKKEFEDIKAVKIKKTRAEKLRAFQEKLGSLAFLDPACGSGNFLTETYLSLRRLENEAISLLNDGAMVLNIDDPIKVTIDQFYGIEINDFAVTVAKTALWIAESQMMKQTEQIVQMDLDFLPLTTNAFIVEGNALRVDWQEVITPEKLNYIMGNPPFVGTNYLSNEQRNDMDRIWKGVKRGKLDFVTCWYVKSAEFIKDTTIEVSFVSTNSIVQGEQASTLWGNLFDRGIYINFAYRTFIWDNEASDRAAVHCVIIGFSNDKQPCRLYDNELVEKVNNINQYLLNAPSIIIKESSVPLCNVPAIVRGSQATDNGYFLFTAEEKKKFIEAEPQSEKYFKRFMMGREFLNNIERWCLWMPSITPSELRKCPHVLERVKAVREFRLASKNKQTQKMAEIPWRFGQYRVVADHYIAFAKVSSKNRRYIPMGYLTSDVVPGDKLFTIPNATLYHLGILESNVHMAWMRTVAGRLKSDYSYSTTIVYNTFPWPNPTDAQKAAIEKTAQGILDARALYPDASLADLYDELTMPPELRKAHQANDKAVMTAYGFDWRKMSESDCVAELMKMYQELIKCKAKY